MANPPVDDRALTAALRRAQILYVAVEVSSTEKCTL
jgi:hypothetical protein